jgi:protein-disulfide isomerase
LAVISIVLVAGWLAWQKSGELRDHAGVSKGSPAGPPWLYGRADARFTLVEYADLECPYCQAYFPLLTRWIDANPSVSLQWHHLPLAAHEPAATREAALAECAAKVGGHTAFWGAVAWIYQHTRGDGQGLPDDAEYPGMTAALRACLDSAAPVAVIQAKVSEAVQDRITATPTLRLLDRQTGKTLTLSGPVEGDALLSAIDLLVAQEEDPSAYTEQSPMPADPVSDMPR